MGFLILFLLRKKFEEHLILESFDTGLPRALNQPILLTILFIILIVFFVLLFIIETKNIKIQKNIKRVSLIVVGIIAIVGVTILIQKIGISQVFKGGMGGSDVTGSRSYTYRIVVQAYGELPLKYKIFGNGQASITSILYRYFGEELSAAGISINSAHDHILDYLIIIGLFGVVCYLGTLVTGIKHCLKIILEHKYVLVFAGVVIAYFAQGIFNIEQTNTTTIFWIMIACCEAMYRKVALKTNNC